MLNQKGRPDIATKILKAITKNKSVSIESILTTDEEKDQYERIVFLDNLMRRHFPALTTHQIWKMYSIRFNTTDKGYYYRDKKNAERVFGSLNSHNKDYKRNIYVSWLENVHSLAMANGDYKAAEKALKTAAEILQLHLPEPEVEERTPTKFELHLNFILPTGEKGTKIINIDSLQDLSPENLKAIADMAERPRIGVKELSQMLDENEQ